MRSFVRRADQRLRWLYIQQRNGIHFAQRHIGIQDGEVQDMCATIGVPSLSDLIDKTVPRSIRSQHPLIIEGEDTSVSEAEHLAQLRAVINQNEVKVSCIGLGYYDTETPTVIQRNVLENPLWYTPYTPYQSEIAQGRLEALFNYQSMVSNITGLSTSNASLLDEGTAAAEAMNMIVSFNARRKKCKQPVFYVSNTCHPQTIAILNTRANSIGIKLIVAPPATWNLDTPGLCGGIVQNPDTYGVFHDYQSFVSDAHQKEVIMGCATDLMASSIMKTPGEMGFDVAIGSSQRFGVPLGFGGPHAAFIAVGGEDKRYDKMVRLMPGRIIGKTVDKHGKPAYRMALQTREQHIRREKATSNICTAQALLANIASFYAVYHGPEGIREIAGRIHSLASSLQSSLSKGGYKVEDAGGYFDTIKVHTPECATEIAARAEALGINIRVIDADHLSIAVDERTRCVHIRDLCTAFEVPYEVPSEGAVIPIPLQRQRPLLDAEVFQRYHTETEMLRYITELQDKDLGLNHAMIPLGSCTMKLNATTEMIPLSWPEINRIHPFAPVHQTRGYLDMVGSLERDFAEILGLDGVSLQPNAGAQGEYAGLLAIKGFQHDRGHGHRDICLIPESAHGTNPASAVLAGYLPVTVACDAGGNINVDDLRAKAKEHKERLAAMMLTYPSTHGVFEEEVKEVTGIIHNHGGQVYLDGANLNAMVGISSPGEVGADVCHTNLHKTFCIPHGGGGPGIGAIGVRKHLLPFLPGSPLVADIGGSKGPKAVSAAPYGSASILPISHLYIRMMGEAGLRKATETAILSANYLAAKLGPHYNVLYRGKEGYVGHEFIVDIRPYKSLGVEAEDVAKRLLDYGFHSPTVSFPINNTIMIEPTESESKQELDRFVAAMLSIRKEIADIEAGHLDRDNNPLINAPHPLYEATQDVWSYPYSRQQAVYPLPGLHTRKFWPTVARVDNVRGDRHLVTSH